MLWWANVIYAVSVLTPKIIGCGGGWKIGATSLGEGEWMTRQLRRQTGGGEGG